MKMEPNDAAIVATNPPEKGPQQRAPRTDLEGDLRTVLNAIVTRELVLPEGKTPTPHTLAGLVADARGDDTPVSAGAVTAALKRWDEVGFVSLSDKPITFVDYTEAGRNHGLAYLKQQHRDRRRKARAAERSAAKEAEVDKIMSDIQASGTGSHTEN